ncbi:MAG: flagellar filament capping protein FliD [Desulfovibrionales bacterium]
MADDLLSSGSIRFTGLGSGTDFESMIEQLLQVERVHINRLESWRAGWEEKVEAFQELNTAMLSQKTTLQGMDTLEEFLVKAAQSSSESVLTATADSTALATSHTVTVNQLAQNEVIFNTTTSESDPSDVINSSGSDQVFAYTYAGGTVSVTVPDGTTLQGLVDRINNDADNPGVKAAALKVGDTEYRLQMWGMDLGAANTLSVDATTTIPGYGSADFTTSQAAQNSQLQVDGHPAGPPWIERDSNTVDDVITGVTLSLKSTGSTTVSVSTDVAAIKEQVQTFVTQTNEVLSQLQSLMKVDDVSGEGSILTGNYGTQIIQNRLKSILAAKGIGFDHDNDPFPSLSTIGISTDTDEGSPTFGLLLLDESELDQALSDDPTAVAELFGATDIGVSDSPDFIFDSLVSGITEPGTYEVAYTVDSGAITSATINGHAASISGTLITGASGYPESGLSVEVTNLTNGSYTGTARVKQGKAAELVQELGNLTSSSDGTLHILQDNYGDIIANIDKKIAFEEERILRMERDLRNKFARLEALLGYYDQMQASLDSQLGQLNNK